MVDIKGKERIENENDDDNEEEFKRVDESGSGSDEDEDAMGLGDMFPREPTPPPPPPSVALFSAPSYLPHPLTIHLVSTNPLWGHLLWNASKILSNHLFFQRDLLVTDKTVLEFGAGGGLPSFVAGVLGAKKVVVTDYPEQVLLENLRTNLRVNAEDGIYPELDGRVIVEGHLWGKNPGELLDCINDDDDNVTSPDANPVTETKLKTKGKRTRKYDTLILSDLIFNHSQHHALLISSECLIEPNTGRALVFHSHHLPQHAERDLGFFRMAKERGWVVENVVEEKVGVMFEEDEGDRELRGTVWGWEMRWPGEGACAAATAAATP